MQDREHYRRKPDNTDDQDTICFELPESEKNTQPGGYYQGQSAPTQPGGYYQGQSASLQQGGYYQGQSAPTQPGCYYQGQSTSPQPGGYYQGQSASPQQGGYYQGQSASPQPGGYYQGQSAPTQPGGYYQGQSTSTQPGGYYQRQSAPTQSDGYYQRQSASTRQDGYYQQQPTSPQQGGQYQRQSASPPPPPPSGGYYPPPYQSPRPPKKKLKKKSPARQTPVSQPPVQQTVVKVKKRRRKPLVWKIIRRVLLSLLSIFLILFGIYSCTSLTLINKMNLVSTGERTRTEGALSRNYVKSVLIIGTDGRSDVERGRSDSMILVSLNSKTNKLTMTSFMRDCNVEIPGYGYNKLNSAYSFGGPELLMDTIEKNFRVKIDNYIQINFSTFASVIDAAGGVDIEMSDAEAESVNVILISEVNELMGDERESDLLEHGGKLHLNGKQALSYSRIRNVGNYDFERTNRQRKVLTALIKKARKGGFSFLRKITKGALPSMTSNMSKWELYKLSLRLPSVIRYKTEQIQIPADGTFTDDPNNPNGWVIEITDYEANYDLIKEKVFSKK